MSQDEALDLALEFFETMQRYKGVRSNIFIKFEPTATGDYFNLQEFDERAKPIITAIKQARSAPVQDPVNLSPFYCGAARIVNGEYKLMDVRNVAALVNNWHPIYAIPENHLNSLYTTPPAVPVQEPDRTGMTYYKNDKCKAASAHAPDCICWTLAAQRKWTGLSEEELQKILQEVSGQGWKPMLEAIEAKLKEKNGM